MSRIGIKPIEVPNGVKAEIAGRLLSVKGPKGELRREIRPEVEVKQDGSQLIVERKNDSKSARAFHGMERALVNNMVIGVSEGFAKELELIGTGYRAELKGKAFVLGLGYSHPIEFPLPDGITGSVIKEGREIALRLEGVDKQLVGQTAARVRALRPPEPYKGKGVRYRGEQIARKAGKSGKK